MPIQAEIRVLGLSKSVMEKIMRFMSTLKQANVPLIPMIGLVHSSTIWRQDGTCEQTSNRFVLSALAKSDLEDEICLIKNKMEIAVRIPVMERFYGSYYFDIHEGEIVNIE